MPGSADAGNGIGGTADKVKVLASCAIATSSITSSHIVDGTIVDGDINGSAAIALSKLASCPLARSGHTGTQTASTISDFDTEVANNTAVAANTAKTGITGGQASAIVANTAKISYCSTASTKLGTIETSATADQTAGEIKTAYESNACTNALTDALSAEITANTAKISYSCAASTAVAANTAKISYCSTASTKLGTIETSATADQSNAEIKTAYEANSDTNALTDALSAEITANTAKTGITGGQASAITANTAKISYCSTASTKLATIASCANNYTHSTNANLTGPITSVGNATAIASGAIAAAKITGPLTNVASHGLAASATTDATCAANIGSGTLPLARLSSITKAQITNTERLENLIIAMSDEETDLEVGTNKAVFRVPYNFTITAIRASVTTAPVGSTIIVDVNESGTTILSTKLSIDASEKTSTTAATAAVISDTALASDAEISLDIDQIGSSTAGTGLKLTFIGYQT